MNNVKAFQAHKEAVRDISFSPTDSKFVSCSDDVTLKIWDFGKCKEENVLTGHGWDVKCVSWHPYKSLIVSGSKEISLSYGMPNRGKIFLLFTGTKILYWEWNGTRTETGC
jgi:polyadenylation factor subunit 2